jgi:hypothetical protein
MTLTILSTFNKRTPEMSRARLTHTVKCEGCGRVYDIDAASYKKHQQQNCKGCPTRRKELHRLSVSLTESQRALAFTPGWLSAAIAKFKQDRCKVKVIDDYDQPLKQTTITFLSPEEISWLRQQQKKSTITSTIRQIINYYVQFTTGNSSN